MASHNELLQEVAILAESRHYAAEELISEIRRFVATEYGRELPTVAEQKKADEWPFDLSPFLTLDEDSIKDRLTIMQAEHDRFIEVAMRTCQARNKMELRKDQEMSEANTETEEIEEVFGQAGDKERSELYHTTLDPSAADLLLRTSAKTFNQGSDADAKGPRSKKPGAPTWLVHALSKLKKRYPQDNFEMYMRNTPISKETGQPLELALEQTAPKDAKFVRYPWIRCNDCGVGLFKLGPGKSVSTFEGHLKKPQHREKVDRRLATEAASS